MTFKILHIVEHGITLDSGYGFRTINILQAQVEKGWQPVLLSFPKPNESHKGCWKEPEMIRGVKCYYRPLSVSRGFLLFPERRRVSMLAKRIREVIEVEKPDLLHAHSPVSNGVATLRTGRKLRIPVVYEIRALWEEAAAASGRYEYHSSQFKHIRSVETWVCQEADQVAVISKGLKNHLIGRGIPAEKLAVVSNGVDVDAIAPCEPDAEYKKAWKLDAKHIIGYIGTFSRYEGLDLLINAVGNLSKIESNVVLLLVGDGPAEAELKTQINRLQLEQKVIMPGRIPPERIPGVYALMDVLAYPRYSISLTELVTPLKPLEAMAMGKALVASDIGGHREFIQHGYNGLLFQPGSASALTEALLRLLDDPDLRLKLARQGATWVHEKHSWHRTTSVYSDIYSQILRRSNNTRIGPGG